MPKILLFIQCLAAVVGIIFWAKFKHSIHKWFIVYLVIIFIAELCGKFIFINSIAPYKINYYSYCIIPLQFIFLFWYMYAFLNKHIYFFIAASVIYIFMLVYNSIFYTDNLLGIKSLSYTVANIFLAVMCILIFLNFLHPNNILHFKNNIMFYVNAGVVLFYIGTLPFFAFYGLLTKQRNLLLGYYTFFLIANIVMYLLFALGFFMHKKNSNAILNN